MTIVACSEQSELIISLYLFRFCHSYYLYFITKAIINICETYVCLFLE